MLIVGNKLYERCADCGEIVCLNKWLFGTLHICISQKDKEIRRKAGIKGHPPLTLGS